MVAEIVRASDPANRGVRASWVSVGASGRSMVRKWS